MAIASASVEARIHHHGWPTLAAMLMLGMCLPGCQQESARTEATTERVVSSTETVNVPIKVSPDGPMPLLGELPTEAVAIRMDPESLSLRVGDSVDLNKVHALIIDSSGRVLGRLVVFDIGSRDPNEARLHAVKIAGFMQLAATAPGTDELPIRVPAFQWHRSTPAPSAQLRIVVQ